MIVIVDSSVWIDFLADRTTEQTVWLDREMAHVQIGITDTVLMEVLQGIRNPSAFRKVRQYLAQHFEVFDTGGEQRAVAAAQNYRLLRTRGFTVRKPIDCLIATFCIEQNYTLLHRDRDFDHFEKHLGLQVVHLVKH